MWFWVLFIALAALLFAIGIVRGKGRDDDDAGSPRVVPFPQRGDRDRVAQSPVAAAGPTGSRRGVS